MINKIEQNQIKDYFLILFLILLVSNPFLTQNTEISVILLFVSVFVLYYKKLLVKVDYKVYLIISFFILFEVLHRFEFGLHNTRTIIRVTSYYIISFLLVKQRYYLPSELGEEEKSMGLGHLYSSIMILIF